MAAITTHLIVSPDGAISSATPLPAGEYVVTITLASSALPGKPFTMDDLPIHDMGWDDSISLRREDMYGDDGR